MTAPSPAATGTQSLEFLAAEMLDAWQQRDPFRAGPFGFPQAFRMLPAQSAADRERRGRDLRSIEKIALDLDPAALDHQQRLTRIVLAEQAGSAADLLDLAPEEFAINLPREFSGVSVVRGITKAPVRDLAEGQAYLRRLGLVPRFLAAEVEQLRAGAAAGRHPARRMVAASIEELSRPTTPEQVTSWLLGTARSDWSGAAAWRQAADTLIADRVAPAIAEYVDALRTEFLPAARADEQIGLSWVPGGDRLYQAYLREETTLELDPQELFDWASDRAAGLCQELIEMLGGGNTLGEALAARVDLRYENPADILTDTRAQSERAAQALAKWFSLPLSQPCQVLEMPEATARNYAGAQYLPGSVSGDRPGVFYINVFQPRYRHEVASMFTGGAVPGSHVFWSYAFAAQVPEFRRVAFIPGFVKGWAGYAVGLAAEMGLYLDEAAELGRRCKELANVARVVVDTGLHTQGWSWQQAVDYLVANTGSSAHDAASEVDRVVCMPGEGPIFAIGAREITAARTRAAQTLGDRFDIREFHDRLLENGSIPLPAMAQVMQDWATGRQSGDNA